LAKKGYKNPVTTKHKDKFDIITDREAWEVKTVGADAVDHKMSVKAKQKASKIAWAKENKKKPMSMLIIVNDYTEVYTKAGLGKFRPGGMKKVATYKNWREEIGHGRTTRLTKEVPTFTSLEEAKIAMNKVKPSPAQLKAIKEYTGESAGYTMNEALREGGKLTAQEQVRVDALRGFIKDSPKVSTTSYRGIWLDEDEYKKFARLRSGDPFIDKGFVSTTYKKELLQSDFIADADLGVEMTIYGKRGVVIESFSAAKQKEFEILFNSESKFIVLHKAEKDTGVGTILQLFLKEVE
jgi:hypothetical protein